MNENEIADILKSVREWLLLGDENEYDKLERLEKVVGPINWRPR